MILSSQVGAMGQGIAIKPTEGVVYAPADAEVTIAFATGQRLRFENS